MKSSALISPRLLRFLGALALGTFTRADAAQPTGPAPELSLSLRGVADGSIEEKESISVAVRIDVPTNAETALTLAPAQGSWVEATAVEIAASADGPALATARAAPTTRAAASTQVTAEEPATGLWWFPPETMGNLPVGNYVVRARLAIKDGSGWKGETIAEPIPLRTVAPSNDPARVTQRILARARAAALGGQLNQAADLLDAALATDAENVTLLGARAAVALGLGQRWGAQRLVQQALALSRQQPGEPSHELHALAEQIERSLQSETSAPPASPALPTPSPAPAASAPSPAQASPAPASPAPAPAAPSTATTPPAPAPATPAVASAAPAALGGAPGNVVPPAETAEASLLSDPAGQWVASAAAGSQYEKNNYSSAKLVGPPDVPVFGNSVNAWSHGTTQGLEWVELTFATPVHATEIRVRQTNAPGAIVKVEAIEPNGTPHLWWEGVDPFKPTTRDIAWFRVRVPRTDYLVARVKLTLNLSAFPGWKQLDAAQLVGRP